MSDCPNPLVPADPRAFGMLIAQLRKAKGITQEEVVNRVPGHYGAERSYRRIELGQHKPSRDAAIAILKHGLKMDSLSAINEAVALLTYAPLDREEITALKLADAGSEPITVRAEGVLDRQKVSIKRFSANPRTTATGIVAIGLTLAGAMTAALKTDAVFMIGGGVIYAALYAVSVFLESQHQDDRQGRSVAAALAFALTLVASVVAVVADSLLVRSGSRAGLILALAIVWTAAAVQWLVIRPALADHPVVPLRYEPLTAQAAHLKNTLYFVLLASTFWLPALHAIGVLERELQLGHATFVQQALSHPIFIIGKSIVSLSPSGLLGACILLIAAMPIMAYPLLGSLKPARRQNGYCILLYTRAALLFVLSFTCLGWYADKLASLLA